MASTRLSPKVSLQAWLYLTNQQYFIQLILKPLICFQKPYCPGFPSTSLLLVSRWLVLIFPCLKCWSCRAQSLSFLLYLHLPPWWSHPVSWVYLIPSRDWQLFNFQLTSTLNFSPNSRLVHIVHPTYQTSPSGCPISISNLTFQTELLMYPSNLIFPISSVYNNSILHFSGLNLQGQP